MSALNNHDDDAHTSIENESVENEAVVERPGLDNETAERLYPCFPRLVGEDLEEGTE